MNVNPDDHTVPILDRAGIEELRRAESARVAGQGAAPATGAWLALVVLGCLIVAVMLALTVLWS
ncbi:hypothetical protein H7X46_19480 [Pseudonocardia sp. C8]|uniref:hypothetical protein n=1 Tax=Pseudonocardia sp. C8 TaxID=2762759 RepID=UPI001642DADD|nr:hypothetical protein [Pseudonocardia sp. C8]MBC3193244.1 hypothetical protein [Pseudonocardia sp. C8]